MAKKKDVKNEGAAEAVEKPEDMPEVTDADDSDVQPASDEPADEPTEQLKAADPTATDGNTLAELRAEAEKNLQGWQRTLAEFQNYKRRVEREKQTLEQKSVMEVMGKILPIIDDFERAMSSVPEEFEEHPWLKGTALILGKFMRVMDDYDIEAIDPQGKPFDPNLHQAVAMDDSDEVESGHVIETLQKGYRSGDQILRSAIVRVAN